MEVRGPADSESLRLHQMESYRIGQRQILVREAAKDVGRRSLLPGANGSHGQGCHVLDHCHELQRPRSVVASEKPGMSLATTRVVVRSAGGLANNLRNVSWRLYDRSTNA